MVQQLGLCACTPSGAGSISDGGTKIPQTAQCSQKKKVEIQKNVCYVHSCGEMDRRICKKTYTHIYTYMYIYVCMCLYLYVRKCTDVSGMIQKELAIVIASKAIVDGR